MTEFRPKFLYKNYIEELTDISDSAGSDDANKAKLIDRNPELQWASVGETSGTRTITISITSTIDRIVLLNTNFKDFTIKYDTSSDFNPAISVSGNADENIYIEFDSVTPSTNVLISVTDTITASTEAKIGELIISAEIMEFSNTMGDNIEQIPRTHQFLHRKSNGAIDKTYIRKLLDYRMDLTKVTSSDSSPSGSDYDNFKSVYEENRRNYVNFIPNPRTQTDVFDGICTPVHWSSGPPDYWNNPLSLQVNGYEGVLELVHA